MLALAAAALIVSLGLVGAAHAAKVIGTPGKDRIVGTAKNDTLIGRGGADTLIGRGGADKINGGRGNDRLIGGPGNDRLNGGPGRDRLNGGPGNDRIDARGNGIDTITCGPGRDTVIADRSDRIARDCENVRLPAPPPVGPPPPPPAAPPPPPPPPVSTRENPVPVGTAAVLSDGWRLTVLSVTPNATAQVLEENRFNDPPAPGFQFFIATVRVTYTGSGSDTFSDSRLRALGPSSVSYSTYSDNRCGVIPNDFPSLTEVFSGGTISGNVCWSVKSSDAAALVMFDDEPYEASDRVWFTLTGLPPPPAAPPPPPPPPVSTRENPVPVGTAAVLSDGWRLTVLSVTPNATAQVLEENRFNDPPAPGFQFFIATVRVTYTGSGSDTFSDSRLRALGPSSVSYSTYSDNRCGVIPNDFPSLTEVFSGGTISGNVC